MSPASYRAAPPRVGSRQPYVTSSTKPNRDKRALFSSINPPYDQCSATADCRFGQVNAQIGPCIEPLVSMASCSPVGARCRDAQQTRTWSPKADAAAGLGRLSDRESDPC